MKNAKSTNILECYRADQEIKESLTQEEIFELQKIVDKDQSPINKVKLTLDKFIEKRDDLLIKLQNQKKIFSEIILNLDPTLILDMPRLTDHRKLLEIAREYEELEIKIRTLQFALGEEY